MPVLEAIFIGTAAFSALMGLEHAEKNKKKAPKKKNTPKKKTAAKKKTPAKKKTLTKKKTPTKKKASPSKKKASPSKKKASPSKKPSGKRWETKLELKKQLSKRGFKFTNSQLQKESITDLRRLLNTLKN